MTTKMSAQRYLRLQTGVVVSHQWDNVKSKGIVEVKDSDGKMHRFDDDPFMTMTSYVFYLVYARASLTLNAKHRFDRYKTNTAQVFASKVDFIQPLSFFKDELFGEMVLPVLTEHGDREMRGLVEWYGEASADASDECEKSESIYRIFRRLRQHPGAYPWGVNVNPIDAVDFPQLCVTPGADTVRITGQDDVFLPALRVMYPEGQICEVDGSFYFKTSSFDPFAAISSRRYEPDLSAVAIHRIDKAAPQVTAEPVVALADESRLGIAIQRLVTLKPRPLQKLSAADTAYVEYGGHADKFSDISASALRGLGKLCGSGPVEDCILRLAHHFADKTGNDLDDCIDFAAGRLVKMNEKRIGKNSHGNWQVTNK